MLAKLIGGEQFHTPHPSRLHNANTHHGNLELVTRSDDSELGLDVASVTHTGLALMTSRRHLGPWIGRGLPCANG